MGSCSLPDVDRMNKVLMDEFKFQQRLIRSATVELQICLKRKAIQICKMLEAIYEEKCQRVKDAMTSLASDSYSEVTGEQLGGLYSTVFGNCNFDFMQCRKAIDHLSINVLPPASDGPEISVSSPPICSGVELDVIIHSGISRAGVFWMSLPKCSELSLRDLSKRISFLKMVDGNWKSYQDLQTSPEFGDRVFVDSECGLLRGQIEKLRGNNMFSVRLLDFGRLIVRRYDALYPAKENLLSGYKYQAFQCCLVLDTDPFDLPIECVWAFNDALHENAANSQSVTCIFKNKLANKNEEEIWQVDLLAKNKKGEIISLSDIVNRKIEDKAKGRDSIACRDIRYSDKECADFRHVERPKEAEAGGNPPSLEPPKPVVNLEAEKRTTTDENRKVGDKHFPDTTGLRMKQMLPEKAANEDGTEPPGSSTSAAIPASSSTETNSRTDAPLQLLKRSPVSVKSDSYLTQCGLPPPVFQRNSLTSLPAGVNETEDVGVGGIDAGPANVHPHSEPGGCGETSVRGDEFAQLASHGDGQNVPVVLQPELDVSSLFRMIGMSFGPASGGNAPPSGGNVPPQSAVPGTLSHQSLSAVLQQYCSLAAHSGNVPLSDCFVDPRSAFTHNFNSSCSNAPPMSTSQTAPHHYTPLQPPPLSSMPINAVHYSAPRQSPVTGAQVNPAQLSMFCRPTASDAQVSLPCLNAAYQAQFSLRQMTALQQTAPQMQASSLPPNMPGSISPLQNSPHLGFVPPSVPPRHMVPGGPMVPSTYPGYIHPNYSQTKVHHHEGFRDSEATRMPSFVRALPVPSHTNYDVENDELDCQLIRTMTFSSQRSPLPCDSPACDRDFVRDPINTRQFDLTTCEAVSCSSPQCDTSECEVHSSDVRFSAGTRLTGQIATPIDSRGLFWMRLTGESALSTQEMMNLQSAMSSSSKLSTELLPSEVFVGRTVLASTSRGDLFRGEIVKVLDRKVVVRNIDRGRTVEVLKDKLKPLMHKLLSQSIPSQAIFCRLHRATNESKFDEMFRKQFDKEMESRNLPATVVATEFVDSQVVTVVQLDLIDQNVEEDGLCLYQHYPSSYLPESVSKDPAVFPRLLAQNLPAARTLKTRGSGQEIHGDQKFSSAEASDLHLVPINSEKPSSQFADTQVFDGGHEMTYPDSKGFQQELGAHDEPGFGSKQGSGQQKKHSNWSGKNRRQRPGQSAFWQQSKEYERQSDSPHSNSSEVSSDVRSNASDQGTRFVGQNQRYEGEDKRTCFNCGGIGHMSKNCKYPHPQHAKRDRKRGEYNRNNSQK